MKKITIILSLLLLFAVGCGQTKTEQTVVSPSPVAESTTSDVPSPQPSGTSTAPSSPPETTKPSEAPQTPAQPASQPTQQPVEEQPKVQTVTVTISVPSEGRTILDRFQVTFEEGDTAFSVLKKATRQNGIHMSFTGGNANPYVEGIDNLYEFDMGAGSGWMCSKNGVYLSKSAGQVPLSAGDTILWVYTLNLGKDIGTSAN